MYILHSTDLYTDSNILLIFRVIGKLKENSILKEYTMSLSGLLILSSLISHIILKKLEYITCLIRVLYKYKKL